MVLTQVSAAENRREFGGVAHAGAEIRVGRFVTG